MRSLPLRLIDKFFAPAPDPLKVGWLGEWDYAHRGLHDDAIPENSSAGFAAAIERGFGIECDVQASSDFQPIVFHDWEFERLTGESGALLDRSSAEISAIELSGNAEPVPDLTKLLDQVAGQVPLLIEVKSRRNHPVERLCLSIKNALDEYKGKYAVMSFDPRVSRWLSSEAPQIVRGLVMKHEHFPAWYGYPIRRLSLWYARPDFLAHDIRDLPTRLPSEQRARGMPVLSWTIRNLELRARAAQYADAPIAEGQGIL